MSTERHILILITELLDTICAYIAQSHASSQDQAYWIAHTSDKVNKIHDLMKFLDKRIE